MSISAVSGSGASFSLAEMMQARRERPDPDEMAASIVEKDDQDGDGFLSLAETSLDEDRFNVIDGDGDGLISTDELSADAQERMADNPPPMQGAEGMASGGSAGSAQSSSGSDDSESSNEEYDQYDLNEDGVVTLDELMQAFRQGDQSLQSLFDGMNGGSSDLIRRLADEAYQAQSAAV